jgi:ATP/maltotriose-dependent transcriptional regulator MalT/DNA-binding SARP family transcriptional activator
MKKTQPTFAKLTVPSLPLIVERPRLFRQLDKARKRPIVWIAGPPGAGKTTLVASYLRARRVRPLWYNVDERDGDLATFFHYLSLAAKQAAPRFRRSLPHLTPEYLLGLPTFTRNFFESLASRLTPPGVLVFDNYHEVPADAPFHELLPVGLRELPRGLAAIIVSRQPPPPAFAGLEAAQLLEVIAPDALRLTKAESDGIMRLRAARERWTLTKTMREKLHGRVQGWVAGLILVLGQVRAGERGAAISRDQPPEVLFEYLASESLRGLSPEAHSFLLKTAQLPVMTVAMAEQLTGLASAGEILARFYRARYFTERRVEAQPWYQYHPLFREFLLARGKTTFPADELKSLQRTAATLLADAGRTEDAMQLWQEAGEMDEVIKLLLAQAPTLMAQGRAQTLESWLRSVPTPMLEQNPWLLFWLGSCRMPFDLKDSRMLFERALQRFKATQDRSGALLAWCGAIESMSYAWDEAIDVDERLAEFERLTQGGSEFPSAEIETRVASAMLSMLVWQRPQSPLIPVWSERILPRLAHLPDLNLMMQIGLQLLLYSLWTGDGVSAHPLLAMLRQRLHSVEAPPLAHITLNFCESAYAWTFGHPEQTLDATMKGLNLAETTGIHILTPWLMGQRVFAKLVTWDVEGAQALLDELQPRLAHREDLNGAFYHHLAGIVCSFRKELLEARRHAELSANLCRRCGALFTEAISRLDLAKILYELGEDRAADRHLTWALEFAREANGSKLIEFIGFVIRADLALKKDNEAGGLVALRAGLAIGAKSEFLYPFLGQSAWTRLCTKALEAGIEPAYVKRLIRIMRLVPEESARRSEAWPWPVKVTTLGRFGVQLHDKPLPQSRKASHRLLSLLQAIVAFGGREVPMACVTDALWPEAEGDAAYRSLISALARLRKLLGDAQAILFHEGRLSLGADLVWVDALAFDSLAQEAERLAREGRAERSERVAEQVLQLYRGSFLADEPDVPWAEPAREKYRARYLRLVKARVRLWMERGEWEQAVACAEEATQMDSLAEPLWRLLMTTLHRAGRAADLPTVYACCRKVLIEGEGRPPSPETERVYKSLRSG